MGVPARYDEAAVSENSAVIMARLSDRLGDVSRAIQQRLIADIPELRDDPRLVELLGASVEGNVDTSSTPCNTRSRSKRSNHRPRHWSTPAEWLSVAYR